MKIITKMFVWLLIFAMLLPTARLVTFGEEKQPITIIYEDESKRGPFEKHFKLSDGTNMAVTYPMTIHFSDENGVFFDIDNRLFFNSNTCRYENSENNMFFVSFSLESGKNMVSLQVPNEQSFRLSTRLLIGDNEKEPFPQKASVCVDCGDINEFAGINVEDATFELKSFSSSIQFDSIYCDVDDVSSKYTIIGNTLKEDIILNKRNGISSFVTEIDTVCQIARVDESGEIAFYNDSNKPVYSISAPVLYDNSGDENRSVSVNVIKTLTGFKVVYSPDTDWLNDEQRQYPVVFDPIITYSAYESTSEFYDTFIGVNSSDTLTTHANDNYITISKTIANGNANYTYGVFYFQTLPSIDLQHYFITDAFIRFRKFESSGNTHLYLYEIPEGYTNYTSFIPSINTELIADSNGSSQYTFNIKNAFVRNMEGLGHKYAIFNKIDQSTTGTVRLYSSNYTSKQSYRPYLSVSYRLKSPESTCFTLDSAVADDLCLLTVSNNSAFISSTRDTYKTQAWNIEIIDTSYLFYTIRRIGSNQYIGCNTDGDAIETGTFTSNIPGRYQWALDVSTDGKYRFYNSVFNKYLCCSFDTSPSLFFGNPNDFSQKEWVIRDCFAIQYDIFTSQNSIPIGDMALSNCEFIMFHPIINKSINYHKSGNNWIVNTDGFCAQTERLETVGNSVILVRDNNQKIQLIKSSSTTNGFYITPCIDGVYEEMYLSSSLDLSSSPTIWVFNRTAGGQYSVSYSGQYLSISSDGSLFLSSIEYLWNLELVSLNVPKRVQYQSNTCGAASSLMILNYFGIGGTIQTPTALEAEENAYISQINNDNPWWVQQYHTNASTSHGLNCNQINKIIRNTYYPNCGNTVNYYQYTEDDVNFSVSNVDLLKYAYVIRESLQDNRPILILAEIPGTNGTYNQYSLYATSSHYLVIRGIYFDHSSQEYMAVLNDCHTRLRNYGIVGISTVVPLSTVLDYNSREGISSIQTVISADVEYIF